MLVVNNGVPKSGSTLLQKLLRFTGAFTTQLGHWQNELWKSPSVPEAKISDFINSDLCLGADPVLIKMHCNPELFQRSANVRVICTHRNLADSLVSMAWHHVRVKKIENQKEWVKNYYGNPKIVRNTIVRFGRHYLQSVAESSLLVKYEDFIANKPETFAEILDFIGLELSEQRILALCGRTDHNIQSPVDFQLKHVRTGGLSVAKEELVGDLYTNVMLLNELMYAESTTISDFENAANEVFGNEQVT